MPSSVRLSVIFAFFVRHSLYIYMYICICMICQKVDNVPIDVRRYCEGRFSLAVLILMRSLGVEQVMNGEFVFCFTLKIYTNPCHISVRGRQEYEP